MAHKAHFLRRPKTTQERRANGKRTEQRDLEYKIRAKRSGANLVDAWDDICTSVSTGWKAQTKRKKQYKVINFENQTGNRDPKGSEDEAGERDCTGQSRLDGLSNQKVKKTIILVPIILVVVIDG